MKVTVNSNRTPDMLVKVITNVIQIKKLESGRYLVTSNESCPTCKHVEKYTTQVLANYTINIELEPNDIINIEPNMEKENIESPFRYPEI